jgi:hypothetical protein
VNIIATEYPATAVAPHCDLGSVGKRAKKFNEERTNLRSTQPPIRKSETGNDGRAKLSADLCQHVGKSKIATWETISTFSSPKTSETVPSYWFKRLFIAMRYKRMNSLLDDGFMDFIMKNILTAPKMFAVSVSMCLSGDKEGNDDAEVRPLPEIALTVRVSLEPRKGGNCAFGVTSFRDPTRTSGNIASLSVSRQLHGCPLGRRSGVFPPDGLPAQGPRDGP